MGYLEVAPSVKGQSCGPLARSAALWLGAL